MFNLIVKDPLGTPPERRLFGSRPGLAAGLSSNLLRLPSDAFNCVLRRFCANLSKISKIAPPVKSGRGNSPSKVRTAQNIKHHPAQNAPEPLAAHRSFLLGFAMTCSLRESLQGYQGLLPQLTQRTSITTCFPLPSTGQAHRPPGGSTSNLQLSESSTRHPRLQATHHYRRCRLVATHQE